MRAKNFVVNRGISCVNRGISCVNRGVSCFIRCILSCFIRCNPVFQSWSSRRERVKHCAGIYVRQKTNADQRTLVKNLEFRLTDMF